MTKKTLTFQMAEHHLGVSCQHVSMATSTMFVQLLSELRAEKKNLSHYKFKLVSTGKFPTNEKLFSKWKLLSGFEGKFGTPQWFYLFFICQALVFYC